MTEIIQSILDAVDKKNVQSCCKKALKKCSFKSAKDMHVLADLAVWLYAYGCYDEVMKVAEIVKDVQFSGNHTLWDHIDSIYCIKARILKEQGNIQEAQKIVDFVNQYRAPHLYKNLVDWFRNTLDSNIQAAIETYHSKAHEYGWRIVKLDCAMRFREAGQFPIPDEELEQIIRDQIEILSKAK